ncbi:MAG: DUF1501 domain-containing protein [Planctomycetota bacterium]|nr:DUF1501 domain-containing protein [Planctomycetota bacterium]
MSRRKRKQKNPISRRQLLGYGLGAAAAAHLIAPLGRPFAGARAFADEEAAPVIPNGGKAKQVVYLFMNGGASHIETFDPKPGTAEGGPTRTIATATKGVHIASSLPQLAKRMGDICLVRGMSTKEGNHERARYLMHTGYAPNPTVTHPSIGSLLSHELGDLEAALPDYIAINGPGARAGFLGVNYEPFTLRVNAPRTDARAQGQGNRRRFGRGQSRAIVENLESPRGISTKRRDERLDFLAKLNDGFSKDRDDGAKKAQAAMFERARRLMDTPQNTSFDYTQESAETKARYGETQFGMGCLLARRLIDEGVSCVEVNMGGWDTHDDGFNRVTALNTDLDRGASALLDDLKASGKLDETLVVWVGDFGRTPRIAATGGRGHYPRAWSMWMAGGGIQGGRVIGKTDRTGAAVTERPVSQTDLMASIAHATGMEPEKVFYSNGRPISLVDESGKVVKELFEA